jgi:hypothetical protein
MRQLIERIVVNNNWLFNNFPSTCFLSRRPYSEGTLVTKTSMTDCCQKIYLLIYLLTHLLICLITYLLIYSLTY